MIDIIELVGMFFGGAMIFFGLLGIFLSPFIIKTADRVFTGESDNLNVWFPLCFWGMSRYAWDASFLKKERFKTKYPNYAEAVRRNSKSYKVTRFILFSVYAPGNIAFIASCLAWIPISAINR
ncbi:hypothetical protein [Larsenimonas suaedae]|uniref:Uncharacterized protein n=1 Tax=Larsenimonas suaedae TaxID=1851019 RepID=A0ABU1GZ59_9GAMM|nr:hypothetical protein [Larsenimonas suaedae]MCM2973486.1 hypothetical protein [Larsenimonas suaedae]MDR5897338.1 hypothetical protein [Larsenimonas suaedae]